MDDTQPVTPAEAGIHDFRCCELHQSWMAGLCPP
jgi:hypothetical protein